MAFYSESHPFRCNALHTLVNEQYYTDIIKHLNAFSSSFLLFVNSITLEQYLDYPPVSQLSRKVCQTIREIKNSSEFCYNDIQKIQREIEEFDRLDPLENFPQAIRRLKATKAKLESLVQSLMPIIWNLPFSDDLWASIWDRSTRSDCSIQDSHSPSGTSCISLQSCYSVA